MKTAETGGRAGSMHHSPQPEYNCGVTTALRLESLLASWHFAFERALPIGNSRKAGTGRNRILYLDSSQQMLQNTTQEAQQNTMQDLM